MIVAEAERARVTSRTAGISRRGLKGKMTICPLAGTTGGGTLANGARRGEDIMMIDSSVPRPHHHAASSGVTVPTESQAQI